MLRRLIGEHIELRFEPGAGEYQVLVDRGQIEQVVLNLVVNARDALADGGVLTLRTTAVDPDGDTRRRLGLGLGTRYLKLSVEDTGVGMDQGTLDHIFDPFFTTKERGRGTGLGLATAYGIVSQHGGAIDVSSELGRGSRFDIFLAIAESARDGSRSSDTLGSEPKGGRETILVAEDEPWVRDLLVETLQRAGYTVVSAEDGEQAAQIFAAQGGRFDLVLLDVVMPRVGGREAWHRMRAVRDDVPVVFSTGYGAQAMPDGLGLGDDAHLLHKPYRYTDLLRMVREILDR
jgi:CheY-like chemotaxis protein